MGAMRFYPGVWSNSTGFIQISDIADLIKLFGQAKSPPSPLSVWHKSVRVNILSKLEAEIRIGFSNSSPDFIFQLAANPPQMPGRRWGTAIARFPACLQKGLGGMDGATEPRATWPAFVHCRVEPIFYSDQPRAPRPVPSIHWGGRSHRPDSQDG